MNRAGSDRPNGRVGRHTANNTGDTDSLRDTENSHPLAASLRNGKMLTGERLDRYQIGPMLGRGGLGHVYRALDTVLNRPVALKILFGQERHWTRKVLQEARAQAAVDHENICKVYDAGYAGGISFIAMKFIEGQTLRKAAPTLDLRQRLTLMRGVVGAVAAAHRLGLIHRDIKPANIMIEATSGGGHKPYVMDFGLARELKTAPISGSHSVKIRGTPAYMSPEQAQPETHQVDTRTDIYSLGATLYELLTGRPPFQGTGAIPIMLKVVRKQVVPPRHIDSTVPRDLELIVLKCLAKDPRDRFESVNQLARELDRFLRGDPIKARGRAPLYWLRKRVAQYKTLSLALVTIALLAGFGIRGRVLAEKRNHLFEDFLDEVQGIEWQLRVSHMMPVHDIRSEINLIRERIDKIAADMNKIGSLALGPGHYAIGRGHLDLGNLDEARYHLEQATLESLGNRNVSYALGEALGKLYERKLNELALLEKSARADKEKQLLKETLLLPALAELKRASGDQASRDTAYIEAQVAFYEDQFERGLALARSAYRQSPWFYEALILQARIHIAAGKQHAGQGDYDQAREAYDDGGSVLAEALAIAQSDLELYLLEGNRRQLIMDLEFRRGGDVAGALAEVLRYCNLAAIIDPDQAAIHASSGYAHYRMAEYLFYLEGLSPVDQLHKSIEAGHRALQLDSENALAYNHLGLAHNLLAEFEIEQRKDPTASLKAALDFNEKALTIYPELSSMTNNRGVLFWQLGEIAYRAGADPLPDLEKSRACFSRVLEVNPEQAMAHNNLGLSYWTQGEYLLSRGENPIPVLEEAVAAFQRAIEINRFEYAFTNQAETLVILANCLVDRGQDPADTLARADLAIAASVAINASDPTHLLLSSQVARCAARWDARNGISPEAGLEQAEGHLRDYNPVSGNQTEANRERARMQQLRVLWLLGLEQKVAAAKQVQVMGRHVADLREQDSEDEQVQALMAAWLWLRSEVEPVPAQARQLARQA